MLLLRCNALVNCGLLFVSSYRYSSRFPVFSTHSLIMGRKGSSKHANPYAEAEYSVSDGIRSVIPYVHEFTTHAKGRWIGREIIEVLTREFGGHPREYWDNAISRGHVRINDKIVLDQYRFKNNDAMLHRTHRHEPSIAGTIEFVGHTETLMAVSKPPSIPVHPCGAYRFNSLMYILAKEPMIEEQPVLFLVHRLDRVTSGLVVLAKSKEAASILSKEIRDKSTKKTYLARVKGIFPKNVEKFRTLKLEEIMNVEVDDDDNDDEDGGGGGGGDNRKNNSKDDKIKDKNNETKNESSSAQEQNRIKQQQQQLGKKRDRNGTMKHVVINESDLPPRVREIPTFDEVVCSDRVGVRCDEGILDLSEGFTLRCPIGVISHRDGIHACDPIEGKEAMTSFRNLGYDSESDTTLVECRPITGRTHQLRLHLQILGNPIANDPCYGGVLFYNDDERRIRAIEVLRKMRREGKHPLSKVPHLGDPELDNPPTPAPVPAPALLSEDASIFQTTESVSGTVAVTESVSGSGLQSDVAQTSVGTEPAVEAATQSSTDASVAELEGQSDTETDQEYLVRTCRYCREQKESQELERLLHCDGIWLHALRYQGSGWKFQAPTPIWAREAAFKEPSTSSD